MSSVILQTESLRKVYSGGGLDTIALDNVGIKIDSGEFIAIMGPSGSGKSTLLNLIGALDSPTSGKIQIDGIETTTLNSAGLALLRNKKMKVVNLDIVQKKEKLKNITNNEFFYRFDCRDKNLKNKTTKLIKKFGTPDIFINCAYPKTRDWKRNSFKEIQSILFPKIMPAFEQL